MQSLLSRLKPPFDSLLGVVKMIFLHVDLSNLLLEIIHLNIKAADLPGFMIDLLLKLFVCLNLFAQRDLNFVPTFVGGVELFHGFFVELLCVCEILQGRHEGIRGRIMLSFKTIIIRLKIVQLLLLHRYFVVLCHQSLIIVQHPSLVVLVFQSGALQLIECCCIFTFIVVKKLFRFPIVSRQVVLLTHETVIGAGKYVNL